MISVPVDLGYHLQGFARADGMLELHPDCLILKLQSRDAVVELLKTDIQKIEIPFSMIEKITYRKSLFGSKVEVYPNDFDTLSRIPNSKDGVVRFKVSKYHRQDAKEIETTCNLAIADSRIRRIDEVLDRGATED